MTEAATLATSSDNRTKSTVNPAATSSSVTSQHHLRYDRFYTCGYDQTVLFRKLFPEYTNTTNLLPLTRESVLNATAGDLVIVGLGGFCDGWRKRKLNVSWMAKNFPGRAMHFNGEPFGGDPWMVSNTDALPDRNYHMGYAPDTAQSVKVPFLVITLAKHPELWACIFVHAHKPYNSREAFLIYTASNCVAFREAAVDALATIGLVHHGGKCWGNLHNVSRI